MSTKHADFLFNKISNRIDELDTDKAKRLEEKERKEQQRAQEERAKGRIERDEQLFRRMAKTREERQDKEKIHQKVNPLQRQMVHGRGRQRQRTYG